MMINYTEAKGVCLNNAWLNVYKDVIKNMTNETEAKMSNNICQVCGKPEEEGGRVDGKPIHFGCYTSREDNVADNESKDDCEKAFNNFVNCERQKGGGYFGAGKQFCLESFKAAWNIQQVKIDTIMLADDLIRQYPESESLPDKITRLESLLREARDKLFDDFPDQKYLKKTIIKEIGYK